MDLAPDEIIVSISLPRGRVGVEQVYRKVGTRNAQAISKVCFAAAADIEDGVVRDVRIALGSVAPTVVRAAAPKRPCAAGLSSRHDPRRARGARPRHRADRRHALDGAVPATRGRQSARGIPFMKRFLAVVIEPVLCLLDRRQPALCLLDRRPRKPPRVPAADQSAAVEAALAKVSPSLVRIHVVS